MSNVIAHNIWCLEIYCHCSLVLYKTYVLQLNTSVLSKTGTHSYATHHPPPPPQQQQQQTSPSNNLLTLHTSTVPLLTHLQIFYFRNKHVFYPQRPQIYSSLQFFLAFLYLRNITDICL
jgi:hypothetical protein